MEANNRKLYTKIIEQTYRQYTIPVYQRLYSWQKQQCNQLYDDIIDSIKKGRNHYLGSLVYSEKTKNNFSFCSIIDGQQRLTTVILLLKALYDSADDKIDKIIKNRIYNSLYNDNCEERYKLKLKSVDSDNKELEKVLMGNLNDLDKSSNIAINYNNFMERIKKSIEIDKITINDIFKGITNLEVVEIILDKEDEPQLIFESINSTGMYLETSDLIRNFLLMGIRDPGKQKEYYKKYWIKLQDDIGRDNIEKFFYDFLVMKDTRYIQEKKVYDNFKLYYRKVNNQEKVFEEIIKFGEYYKLIVCNNSKLFGKKSNELCSLFGLLKHSTINPFLLKVCDDFKDIEKLYNGKAKKEEIKKLELREEEFNKILFLFGNYALRRAIAEVPSSSLRRFYAGLYSKVFGINKENLKAYYKAVEAYLCTLKTNDRMPNNKVFEDSLIYNNIYKKPKILRYFFDFIENDNKEPVDMSDMTIEHILPETLSNQWKKDLGKEKYQEIYDKYVHTLGNLSITGYNSEYSNYRFIEKKKKFKELYDGGKSKIKTLNKELLNEKIEKWGETQIVNRAKRLADNVIKKYPYPEDIDTSLEFEKYYEFYIDNEDDDGGEYVDNPMYKLYGFKYDGAKHKAKYFKDIYIGIVRSLYSANPSILDELAKQNFKFEKGTKIVFSRERVNQWQVEIAPTLFIEVGYSRHMIFWLIRMLFKKYQLDIQDFCVLFTDKE